jgi:hypothetical protein
LVVVNRRAYPVSPQEASPYPELRFFYELYNWGNGTVDGFVDNVKIVVKIAAFGILFRG